MELEDLQVLYDVKSETSSAHNALLRAQVVLNKALAKNPKLLPIKEALSTAQAALSDINDTIVDSIDN